MLEKFIIEVLLCELCIQRKQRTVFLSRISKRRRIRNIPGSIFLNLFLSCVIVLLRRLMLSQHILHIRTVHIGFGKIRIKLDSLVIVLESIPVLSELDKD